MHMLGSSTCVPLEGARWPGTRRDSHVALAGQRAQTRPPSDPAPYDEPAAPPCAAARSILGVARQPARASGPFGPNAPSSRTDHPFPPQVRIRTQAASLASAATSTACASPAGRDHRRLRRPPPAARPDQEIRVSDRRGRRAGKGGPLDRHRRPAVAERAARRRWQGSASAFPQDAPSR